MNRCTFLVLTALSLSVRALGGSLTPPAGPVGPTPGPEPRTAINTTNTPGDADSIFKITQPGSYYLQANITGVAAKSGIEVAAGGVSIDLMGFDLVGVAGSMSAIVVSGLRDDLSIRNGTIRDWGDRGVGATNSESVRLADVLVSGCVIGVQAGGNSVLTGCTTRTNSTIGINVGTSGVISACASNNNGTIGILTGNGCVVSGCLTRDNTTIGILVGIGGTVVHCSTHSNTGDGISASAQCTIVDCTASGNTLDGIRVTSGCTVRGNTCGGNGAGAGDGANIRANGNDNRIEGNTCTGADRGIQLDGAGNFYVRNICSGNTNNWDVVAGNAGIIFVAQTNAAGFTGSSGGISLGSTDPNANWSY